MEKFSTNLSGPLLLLGSWLLLLQVNLSLVIIIVFLLERVVVLVFGVKVEAFHRSNGFTSVPLDGLRVEGLCDDLSDSASNGWLSRVEEAREEGTRLKSFVVILGVECRSLLAEVDLKAIDSGSEGKVRCNSPWLALLCSALHYSPHPTSTESQSSMAPNPSPNQSLQIQEEPHPIARRIS